MSMIAPSDNHYVAYHSVDERGWHIDSDGGRGCFETNKSALPSKGDVLWCFEGEGTPKRYKLMMRGIVTRIKRQDGEASLVYYRGPADFSPADVTSLPWFQRLAKSQGSFSFGLNIIRDLEKVEALERFVAGGDASAIRLDQSLFKQQFACFDARVVFHSDGNEHFSSFREGFPDQLESYKVLVRNIARDRLGFNEWRSSDIGTGKILRRVIDAIEIKNGPDIPRNNLVAWQVRYGPERQPHRALLGAVGGSRSTKTAIERWFFDFFRHKSVPNGAFAAFRNLVGRDYDLVAYIFFLKDADKFMPIAPTTFDAAFKALGIPLRTARNCSWDNYLQYNAALGAIQAALRDVEDVRNARLIDAHSFCWISARSEFDISDVDKPAVPMPVLLGNVVPPPEKPTSIETTTTAPVLSDDYFSMRDASRRRLGRLAEEVALASEKKRLRSANRPDLAKKVKSVSDQPALGYDIKSFEVDEADRHIEVKAARYANGRFDFFVTRNELARSGKLSNYYFYLVLDAGKRTPSVSIIAAETVGAGCFVPEVYLASCVASGSVEYDDLSLGPNASSRTQL
jgi:hypothetical protein